jgi:iron complex transport system substrate-binding protein
MFYKKSPLLFTAIMVLLTISCSRKTEVAADNKSDSLKLKYAVGFSVHNLGNAKLVSVNYPYQGAKKGYKYLLIKRGAEVPTHDPNVQVITIPIENIVCTSTSHIPLLDYLNKTEALIGFPSTDYISSEKMRKRIDNGSVVDLGIDKGMNLEVLYSLHPDLVMGYTMSKDLGQLKKIEELGMPVVINADYLETHPLGRAEWIKYMALFFNKEKEADSVFNVIENEYLSAKNLIQLSSKRPTVMSGILYGDAWFMPGGKNYASHFYEDAGLNYLWNDTESNGFLELSFESVYAKAKDADLWIGVGSFSSLQELKSIESRYELFKPFTEGEVYTYNYRKGATGGSEYLELGYLRPDLVLKDLIRIGHPELLPDYQLYFHKKLE